MHPSLSAATAITSYCCEIGKPQQRLLRQMGHDLIFNDASDMQFALAATCDGKEEPVPRVEFKTCGWMCNSNSTANPWRAELADDVAQFLVVSGETLYYFADSPAKDTTAFGFGENATA